MKKLNCKLLICSTDRHLNQVYSGFGLLEKEKKISIELQKDKEFNASLSSFPILKVILDNNIHIIYDTHDSSEIPENLLEWADFYFKRGFLKHKFQVKKVFPLGFNYSVLGSRSFALKKFIYMLQTKKKLDRHLRRYFFDSFLLTSTRSKRNNSRTTCAIEKFEQLPIHSLNPIIIYQTRVWKPNSTHDPNSLSINKTRVECLKVLRKNFPENFVGGLYPSLYAKQHFPELVLSNENLAYRYNYLKLLKKASICVATTGLWNSIGGKMGEYVAGSKAIVSEKLIHSVPGDFIPNKNYLEFSEPEECVEQINYLMTHHEFRYQMMLRNKAYYHSYLRPDILIWNTLHKALFITETN